MSRLWDLWLAFDHPLAADMARAARELLTGDRMAVVRQPLDSDTGMHDPFLFVLYTLEAETPDPAAVSAAASGPTVKPAGALLEHRLLDNRAELPRRFTSARSSDLLAVRRTALRNVEAAITDGLRAREGFYLVPVIPLRDLASHFLLFGLVKTMRRLVLESLYPNGSVPLEELLWEPKGIAVCDACTLVFRPRTTAHHCSHCARRRAAPALGGLERSGDWRLERWGDRQTIRVPKLLRGTQMVRGWREVTVGLCSECGASFSGRADKRTCDKPACRQRRKRRRAAVSRLVGAMTQVRDARVKASNP